MRHYLKATANGCARAAEFLAVGMLVAMFLTFLLTILYRYVLNWPAGWAAELSTVLWMWLVLFGAAFVTRERDEIRFDILFGSLTPKLRRTMVLVFSVILIGLFVLSLPAVWDYVTFMRVQRTAYLQIRYDWLFSIYVVFAVAIILRYGAHSVRAVMGRDLIDDDDTAAGPPADPRADPSIDRAAR